MVKKYRGEFDEAVAHGVPGVEVEAPLVPLDLRVGAAA